MMIKICYILEIREVVEYTVQKSLDNLFQILQRNNLSTLH